ncbi:MAG: Clp protease ClpP [Butyrivibrio sp.]|nr:Clp protease ClpP [Butyrivibrio sp.]
MKHKINIRGVLIPNNYKWYYDFFGEESTCPADVQKVLDAFQDGDEIEVYINSPGGVIATGSEIYSLLKSRKDNVKIYIVGEACSAASIIAMAGHCEMSPTALMMVHCVSVKSSGNHTDMEHTAEMLRTADLALSTAYVSKSGMNEEEVLDMMEHETWLTAEQAKEKGLIDGIMFEEEQAEDLQFVAGPLFALPGEEQMQKVKALLKQAEPKEDSSCLTQAKLNLLKLKGEIR